MRIWSLHPQYLDAKGLVALWRETLLAKHVLEGKTQGYKSHPQLLRFKQAAQPLDCINQYLFEIYNEATLRNYNFNKKKINKFQATQLTVTQGQLDYEFKHLLKKLKIRDHRKYISIRSTKKIQTHPLFSVVPGEIEPWEIVA